MKPSDTLIATPPPDGRLRVELLDGLNPAARNPRTHSIEQTRSLADIIRRFGWTRPIFYDFDAKETVVGHGASAAARMIFDAGDPVYLAPGKERGGIALPMGHVPVLDVTGWNEDERRAYLIADNAIAERAGWDYEMLGEEIRDLQVGGFDIDLTGFDSKALDDIFRRTEPEDAPDPDAVPEPPAKAMSRLGDLWTLGDHRLLCGDSTNAEAVGKCLNGTEPHLMVTDPPYGVEYDANWRNERVRSNGSPIGGRAVGKVSNDERADWSAAWRLFHGDVAYVWCAPGPLQCAVHDSLGSTGLIPRMQIVWAKNQLVIGRGHYHAQHENCWYAVRRGQTAHWSGDRKQTTVWNIAKPHKSETGHSTQKPIECMERPIRNNSERGDAVYDPFGGSGTTLIACERTGRHCRMIEIDPAYCDVIVMRWQQLTGKDATLDGRTFNEVRDERLAEEPVEA